ncbi:hypothetical protein ACD491_13725, partial [Clostridioides difficile]|uniref:hypothetical protein n=1 Tax=Clostridioides difficile TaxID=1496 RepID=UPI00355B1CD5
QYLIYLDIVQRAWADRSLTTDEQDRIKHEAYAEYKRIERDTEEAEELLMREEFETDRPIDILCRSYSNFNRCRNRRESIYKGIS